MLEDMIRDYALAVKNNDRKAMERIERGMRQLGMDRATLITLAKEYVRREWKK